MSEQRRFSDEEVAEILERATAVRSGGLPASTSPAGGLTLDELKEIGAEAGIDGSRIEEAAAVVSSSPASGSVPSFLGVPRAVSRVVSIPRAMDDSEWDRLVVELRQTFDAAGRVSSEGALRSWTNGNLQVHVEPDADGGAYRLRMRTLKGDLLPRMAVGGTFLFLATVMLLADFLGAGAGAVDPTGWVFALAGLAVVGHARWMLGGWSEEREEQFQWLARRVGEIMKEPDAEE